MALRGFKNYIVEAFQKKDLEKATLLIQKYLEKKLGKMFRDPDEEEFKKSTGETGYGIRYYLETGMSIRFNFIQGIKSDGIHTIDVWQDGAHKNSPSATISVAGVSTAKFLPKLASMILNPVQGDYMMESKLTDAMELLQGGMTRKEVTEQGFSNGTVFHAAKKLGMTGGVTITSGGSEKVKTPQRMKNVIKDVMDDTKVFTQKMIDLEEIAGAIARKKLNALLVTGRPGCFHGSTNMNVRIDGVNY